MTPDDRALITAALAAIDAAMERLPPLHLELRRVEEAHWLRRLFMAETGQPTPDAAKAAADLLDGAANAIAGAGAAIPPEAAESAARAVTWGRRVWESNDHIAEVMGEVTVLRTQLAQLAGE